MPDEYEWFTLYATGEYRFPILFYLDRVGAVYLFCVWAIFSIIVKYCRVYLHREDGCKRFFLTIFGFVFGLNLVIMSCSIDMLFAGWEIAGYASLLLLSSLILIAASGKSAQFPFCFWLPRAMEGPTPSSAIFYGALPVYLGVCDKKKTCLGSG